MKEKATK